MAPPFTPYSFFQCPCFDATNEARVAHDDASTPTSASSPDDDEKDFDPRSPRSNYSLYPLEYMLFCDVCHQIRCPRCAAEELVTVYCPSCLFEVGGSSVKTEGNRCTRSCFQCPICIGPLAVQSLEAAPEPALLSADNATPTAPGGPWVLNCSYCHWSSLEIDVKFDKPQGIFSQLSKLRSGDSHDHISTTATGDMSPIRREPEPEPDSTKARFGALKSFYSSQLANSNTGSSISSGLSDYGFGSPGTLSRIMSIYSSNPLASLKPKYKPTVMREADTAKEGLRISDLDETQSISDLQKQGYDRTATRFQASSQTEEGLRLTSDLWPIPVLLRTKRAKRCQVCRHILSKPESKISNTRWRIRLIAANYVPTISIKPLVPIHQPGMPPPSPTASLLKPLQPAQYIITFKNPLFEEVKVSLATPAKTPGRFESKVTVLCPQFTMGANSDDYNLDEVLKEDDKSRRQSRRLGDEQQVEAGKEWERGRNWVSIIVEVIPASLKIESKPALVKKDGEGEDLSPLKEDEDVLEIPMFIRLEWEADATDDKVGSTAGVKGDKDGREKRELAYWSVLGIGRISQE